MPYMRSDTTDLEQQLEQHRDELTHQCAQVLGSRSEAEDAVQEAFVRAWRFWHRFERRSSTRTWLYRIATNTCIDMMKRPQRRAYPMEVEPADESPADTPGSAAASSDPAEAVVAQEALHDTLLVALRHLPSRQPRGPGPARCPVLARS